MHCPETEPTTGLYDTSGGQSNRHAATAENSAAEKVIYYSTYTFHPVASNSPHNTEQFCIT